MKPEAANTYGVKAECPSCGVASYFDWRDTNGNELGSLLTPVKAFVIGNHTVHRQHWRLLRCSNCRRGALASFFDQGGPPTFLDSFLPQSRSVAKLPVGVPDGVVKEFREAELCSSVGGRRGASALVRSALERR